MLLPKKQKIEQYLSSQSTEYTAFYELLTDYQNGNLKEKIKQFGIKVESLY